MGSLRCRLNCRCVLDTDRYRSAMTDGRYHEMLIPFGKCWVMLVSASDCFSIWKLVEENDTEKSLERYRSKSIYGKEATTIDPIFSVEWSSTRSCRRRSGISFLTLSAFQSSKFLLGDIRMHFSVFIGSGYSRLDLTERILCALLLTARWTNTGGLRL